MVMMYAFTRLWKRTQSLAIDYEDSLCLEGIEEGESPAAVGMGQGYLSLRIILVWRIHCVRKSLVGESFTDSHVDSFSSHAWAAHLNGGMLMLLDCFVHSLYL